MKDKYLTISEVSKFLGVSEKTLRIWEEKGRLVPDERTDGGHRRYLAESVREFFRKEGPVKGELLDEYVSGFIDCEYDRNAEQKYTDRIVDFIISKGFLKTEKESDVYSQNNRTLAILIDGSLRLSHVIDNHNYDDDYWVDILIKFWEKFQVKNIVGVSPMMGPTGMVYYMKRILDKDMNCSIQIDSDPVIAGLTFFNKKFVCHKKYGISYSDGVDLNSGNLSNDLTDSIISTLAALAIPDRESSFGWRKGLAIGMKVNGFNGIVTNELGLSLLKNRYGCEFPEIKDRMSLQFMGKATKIKNEDQIIEDGDKNEYDIYYHPNVEKFLLYKKGSSLIDSGYFFCPYLICPFISPSSEKICWRGNYKAVSSFNEYYRYMDF